MEGPPADYPALFREAALKLDVDAVVESYPHIEPAGFSRDKLRHIRQLLTRRSPDEIVFFCPGALEHFVEGADMSFQFSAYRSWFDPGEMTVIAHPWTPTWSIADRPSLRWSTKPPCTIGFMGSGYANSRVGRLAAQMPKFLRRYIVEGWLVRDIDRVAWLDEHKIPFRFLPTFPRAELLREVEGAPDPGGVSKVEIIDTSGFDFSKTQKEAFAGHLARTTYVLCPRGCENYSFRAYEALRFGRVPVILDTDMVFPTEIDWNEVAIIVDGRSPELVRQKIVEDYERRDAAAFLNRQQRAFETSDSLDGDDWLTRAIAEAIAKVDDRKALF